LATFKYNDFDVHVSVKPRQKNSYLRIKGDSVHISTPYKKHTFYIDFIESRLEWIEKHLLDTIKIDTSKQLFLYGELIDNPQTLQNKIDKNSSKTTTYQDAYHKEQTILHVESMYQKYTKQMNLFGSKITYRKMKRRWGSCNAKGELTFNTMLSKLPLELIEYVVVHELSHLKHMNHSKAFHLHVKRYLENEKSLRGLFKKYPVL